VPLPPQRSDEDSSLGRKIAQLDAATGEYRDGVLVERIAGLGPELYRLAEPANLKLESPAWSPLVGVINAYDR